MRGEFQYCGPNDPFFTNFARSLAAVFDDYIAAMDCNDAPWVHKECAMVGFLSAAAWKMGAVSLLEYGCEKTRDGEVGRGRNDLYICHHRKEYFFEAKWCQIDCSAPSDTIGEKVQRILDHATRDATAHNTKDRYAVSMITPSVGSKSAFPQSIELFEPVVRTLQSNGWFYLTYFHPSIEQPLGGSFVPGVVIAFKNV